MKGGGDIKKAKTPKKDFSCCGRSRLQSECPGSRMFILNPAATRRRRLERREDDGMVHKNLVDNGGGE